MRLNLRRAPALAILFGLVTAAYFALIPFAGNQPPAFETTAFASASLAAFVAHVILGGLLWWTFPPGDIDTPPREFWRPLVWRLCLAWYLSLAGLLTIHLGLSARGDAGRFVGLLSVFGMFALAATAWHGAYLWDERRAARSEVAALVFTTHMLIFILICARIASVASGGDATTDALAANVSSSLTVLALPVCAGLWARLKLLPQPDGADLAGLRADRILFSISLVTMRRGCSLALALLMGGVCPASSVG